MRFVSLPLVGAFTVIREARDDERGSFARIWSSAEFAELGLAAQLAEMSLSYTSRRGTLRGLHYQVAPHAEAKLVTCVRGTIWDVIVDLRSDSPSYRQWHGTELDAVGADSLYIPEGCAHGFIALSDDVLVMYQITDVYDPTCARGVRWNDPAFAIDWPLAPSLMNERDRSFSDYGQGSPMREEPGS
jgi:dTDP-4-dehydrorhamnose 3,5-epimerase